jgi:hypothetical protein
MFNRNIVKLWLLLFLDHLFEVTSSLRLCNVDWEDTAKFIAQDKAVKFVVRHLILGTRVIGIEQRSGGVFE